jgi:hypothetical protein
VIANQSSIKTKSFVSFTLDNISCSNLFIYASISFGVADVKISL